MTTFVPMQGSQVCGKGVVPAVGTTARGAIGGEIAGAVGTIAPGATGF